jgi:hypothetical protein
MPLHPLILMIFGVAIVLAAAIWYRPRVGIGRGEAARSDGQSTSAHTRHAQGSDGTEAAGRIGIRDWIGWPIGLFGIAVAAYGLYLQVLA